MYVQNHFHRTMNTKITLRTGFDSVTLPEFRDDTLRKGKTLLKAERIFAVEEIQGDRCEIQGKCVPEMSVNGKPYQINILLNQDRTIQSMYCSCLSGVSGQCKHACALLLYINEERDESKTDLESQWSKPSERNKSLHRKGKSVDELLGRTIEHPKFFPPNESALKRYEGIFKKHGLTSSGMYKLLTVPPQPEKNEQQPDIQLYRIPQWVTDLFYRSDFSKPDYKFRKELIKPEDLNFFLENIDIPTKEASVMLFVNTIGQSSNPEWLRQRKFRVTASISHSIFRARSDKNRMMYFLSNSGSASGKSCLAAINYGREMETEARKKFEEISGKKIHESGLVVRSDVPFLGASPDGIILDTNGISVLEIKCPFKCKDSIINVDYIDEKKQLKKSHQYYTQVQMQLFCCNSEICYFFVYSSVDYVIVSIPREQEFI